ncbi:hypothetical protein JOB18_048498 [Solea senegalensis]|uniref:Uncharacterized protein n=1 Tax=Solea senegalensis TaxID=28829 RepID=A0AAV6SV94_SOLSE|nr:hypothetical protein JOB18_048498 [Solea senegalensis]
MEGGIGEGVTQVVFDLCHLRVERKEITMCVCVLRGLGGCFPSSAAVSGFSSLGAQSRNATLSSRWDDGG